MVILVTGPNSVGIFLKFTTFLSTLRWPQRENEMVKFGVFFLGMLFERWAGHRLQTEKTLPLHERAGRTLTLAPTPISEGYGFFRGASLLGVLSAAWPNWIKDWPGSSHVVWVLIAVGFGILGGYSAAIVQPPGPGDSSAKLYWYLPVFVWVSSLVCHCFSQRGFE